MDTQNLGTCQSKDSFVASTCLSTFTSSFALFLRFVSALEAHLYSCWYPATSAGKRFFLTLGFKTAEDLHMVIFVSVGGASRVFQRGDEAHSEAQTGS
jgi:hypothetical protein